MQSWLSNMTGGCYMISFIPRTFAALFLNKCILSTHFHEKEIRSRAKPFNSNCLCVVSCSVFLRLVNKSVGITELRLQRAVEWQRHIYQCRIYWALLIGWTLLWLYYCVHCTLHSYFFPFPTPLQLSWEHLRMLTWVELRTSPHVGCWNTVRRCGWHNYPRSKMSHICCIIVAIGPLASKGTFSLTAIFRRHVFLSICPRRNFYSQDFA